MRLFPRPWGNYLIDGIVETTPPEMVNLLPTTLGWQIIYAILLLMIIKKAYTKYAEYKRNAYRRAAIKILAKINSTDVSTETLRQLPALLRTTALHAFEREIVSAKSGSNWEVWLDEQCPESKFSSTYSGILQQLAFAPTIHLAGSQVNEFIQHITFWVENHRRQDA